ncbi:hypothetical protein CES85_2356 [Ochrobactrum quorumnocens]|uniref:Uncharacterized protein n=1 Tax=Ochrobactrum quorumnocens TaxID=271865 RepID=A0A248UFW5_9HYPH|nr:hypothetical protein CES85_2356 [[Ochrobactrum] quorumnocens]
MSGDRVHRGLRRRRKPMGGLDWHPRALARAPMAGFGLFCLSRCKGGARPRRRKIARTRPLPVRTVCGPIALSEGRGRRSLRLQRISR